MDKHTFIGKRKVGFTDICDFTDFQGIGHDPLYKRYESVNSIVRKNISPLYAHFLAAPHYSADDDVINWYVDDWKDVPVPFSSLSGEKKARYSRIKDETIDHYRNTLQTLSGEELQVMACALRYIDDNFIFCADDKVYLLAWGMTPDTRKHISVGELVHAAPDFEPDPEPEPEPPLPEKELPPAPPVTPPEPPVPPVVPPIVPPALPPEKKKGFPAWLKWLLWGLLGILLLLLILFILSKCTGCHRAVNGVVPLPSVVLPDGDSIDNNGVVTPVEIHDGRLPDEEVIVAPIRDENGALPPIVRDPGVPPVFGNRLFLFLENEDDSVDALADDFKKAYPGSQYAIIGFDRDVKSLVIQIPENERDHIRKTINSKIPNHKFIVFDEEIYELNARSISDKSVDPGWHLKAVKAPQGWNITRGNPSVKIAVVDDGIQADHPIFKNRIVDAYNVFTQNNHLSYGEGHGTHTAGLAAGSTEYMNKGAAGIAPECMLMPIQVIDNGQCPLSALVSGIMYAIHKGADVVNISIGPSFSGLNQLPPVMQSEIARTQFKNVEMLWRRVCNLAAKKNVILVFAAGNDDIYSSIPPENRTKVAITVGAVDKKLYPTEFTNYGPCTDISAPGNDIYSSFPKSKFTSADGTSMAAPIVTGAIALMKSLNKNLTVEQARNVLYRTGTKVYGYMPPMLQINLALEAVKKGDYSAPPAREYSPVPESAVGGFQGTPPASWTDGGSVVVTDPGVGSVVGPANPEDGRAGQTAPVTPVNPGVDQGSPRPSTESNYDEIRKMIEMYKKKIVELEGQLPENQKR